MRPRGRWIVVAVVALAACPPFGYAVAGRIPSASTAGAPPLPRAAFVAIEAEVHNAIRFESQAAGDLRTRKPDAIKKSSLAIGKAQTDLSHVSATLSKDGFRTSAAYRAVSRARKSADAARRSRVLSNAIKLLASAIRDAKRTLAALPALAVTSTSSETQTAPTSLVQGAAVMQSIRVADASVNPATVSRNFWIERPGNLTGPAPLLVLADQPGYPDTRYWEAYSVTGGYEILMISTVLHGAGQPSIPTIADTEFLARYPYHNCGTTGVEVCDDVPYVKAAIDWALANTNVDPTKVYLTGASKGGSVGHDLICDTRTSRYFHAAELTSSSLASNSHSGQQSVPPECPALLGTSNGFGGAAGLSPNTNLSLMWVYGTNDFACNSSNPACLDTGGTASNGQWGFSNPQDAGDSHPPSPGTVAGTDSVFGYRAFRCSGMPSTDMTYGTGNVLRKRIYTGCTNPKRATETLRVTGGGHAVAGMQGVGGLDIPAEAWHFFMTYGRP